VSVPNYGVKLNLDAKTFKVPFGRLADSNNEYLSNVREVIESGELIGGKYVNEFEIRLAAYLRTEHVVSVASGMDALTLAILSLNLQPDSKILVANNAGGYASLAVLNAGHIPLFCDVSIDSYLITFENIQELKVVPAAIILTHLYGKMTDIMEIRDWADDLNIPIIEDCAQAIGAEMDGLKAGTIGTLGCFSFYPTKNLGGIGDGGAIATNDAKLASKIRNLKQYGWHTRYQIQEKHGINSRLDAINSSVLTAKIDSLDVVNNVRRNILKQYRTVDFDNNFFDISNIDNSHVAHLAVGRASSPTNFIDYFKRKGIEVSRHYPYPDSELPGLNYKSEKCDLKNSKVLCNQVVSLPLYPSLSADQIELVCSALKEYLNTKELLND
jgi:aminotransferase EvaB